MPGLVLRGAIALMLCCSVAAGCRKKDGGAASSSAGPATPSTPAVVPILGTVTVQDGTPDEARPAGVVLDEEMLAAAARKQLVDAQVFALPDAPGPQSVATVAIALSMENVEVGKKAAARLAARVKITVKPEGLSEDRWSEDTQVGAEAPYEIDKKRPPDRPLLFRRLAERTLHDVLEQYVVRQKLRTAAESEVVSILATDKGELREEAIKVSGERKIAAAVPRLLELLDDPDESVRDASLGTLVQMRERRTVGVLTRSRSLRDRREMRKIVDAVTLLGGQEAKDYLEFVAAAHDDADMKQLAKDALARMARRSQDSPEPR